MNGNDRTEQRRTRHRRDAEDAEQRRDGNSKGTVFAAPNEMAVLCGPLRSQRLCGAVYVVSLGACR